MELVDLKFDAIYCINLQRRPDRLKRALEELTSMNIPVTVFDAVDAKKMGLSHVAEHMKPGMIGCFLSHYIILQQSVMLGHRRILVLEDDLNFITGARSLLAHALPIIPSDWQFAYLGYSVYPEEQIHTKIVNNYWCVPGASWGTQAYMLNGADAINTMYESLKSMKYQVDVQLSRYILPNKKLKYYAITPSCIKQNKALGTDVQS